MILHTSHLQGLTHLIETLNDVRTMSDAYLAAAGLPVDPFMALFHHGKVVAEIIAPDDEYGRDCYTYKVRAEGGDKIAAGFAHLLDRRGRQHDLYLTADIVDGETALVVYHDRLRVAVIGCDDEGTFGLRVPNTILA